MPFPFVCVHLRALVKINRGIVVNVDVVTGIVIPIEVEIINYIVHGKIKNSGGHKKHRQRGINSQVGKLITEIPVTHAMT